MSLNIVETFYSLQGEGPLTGTPSYFIRFEGCVLKCKFCDSKRAWNPNDKNIPLRDLRDKIINNLISNNITHVVITGGEPLINHRSHEFISFVKYLILNKIHITFETTGLSSSDDILNTTMDKNFKRMITNHMGDSHPFLFMISPKIDIDCYKIKVTFENIVSYYQNSTECSYLNDIYFKVIYSKDQEDLLKVFCNYLPDKKMVMIMPKTNIPFNKLQYEQCALDATEFCLKHGYRLSDRLHVRLWGLKDGV